MKLNIKTNSKTSDSNELCRDRVFAGRPDRSVSREELCRLVAAGKPAVGVVERKAVSLTWLDKLASWVSALLWKKTVLGYQDEQGFHYGTPPVSKEPHAISD